MPSEQRVAKYFRDITAAIDLIEQWVSESGGPDQAVGDAKVRSAIERQLLTISEAAIRIDRSNPGTAEQLAPDIDWSGLRGMGNFIRHKYDDLDLDIVIDVLRNRLAALRAACAVALTALSQRDA